MIVVTLDPQGQGEATVFALHSEDVGDATGPSPSVPTEEVFEIARLAHRELDGGASEEVLAAHGLDLFKLAFGGSNREFYSAARVRADERGVPLLIRVRLSGDSRLQAVPWELLHDGRCFLAKDRRTGLVRWITIEDPVKILAIQPPLRVLLTTASPRDLEPLDLDREEAAVRKGLKVFGTNAELTPKHRVSVAEIFDLWRDAMNRKNPFHLWHHCGHGRVNHQGEFGLALENGSAIDTLSMSHLGELLGFDSGLRAAVFQTCFSASRSGTTSELARIGVPVVVGFRRRISDISAHRFASALFQSLFFRPIELGVNEGRIALAGREWSDVVVVSRRRDHGLFFPAGSLPIGLTGAEMKREVALRRQRTAIRKFLKAEERP